MWLTEHLTNYMEYNLQPQVIYAQYYTAYIDSIASYFPDVFRCEVTMSPKKNLWHFLIFLSHYMCIRFCINTHTANDKATLQKGYM